MKRKRNLFIISLFLLLGGILLWRLLLFPSNNKSTLYYIPQVEMYLKIINPLMDKYGYILIGKDSILSLSNQVDYIRVYKSETSNINILIDPRSKNKLFINDRFNSISLNPVNYEFNKTNIFDTVLFSKEKVMGIDTYIVKHPFIDIMIDGYLESIYIKNDIQESSYQLQSIKGK